MVNFKGLENKFKNCKWTGLSSANGGVFWLTKPELIKLYSDFYYKGEGL